MEAEADSGRPEEELARKAAKRAMEQGSTMPLVDAAELLIAAVMEDPELTDLLGHVSNNEIDAIAEHAPGGHAARLREAREN